MAVSGWTYLVSGTRKSVSQQLQYPHHLKIRIQISAQSRFLSKTLGQFSQLKLCPYNTPVYSELIQCFHKNLSIVMKHRRTAVMKQPHILVLQVRKKHEQIIYKYVEIHWRVSLDRKIWRAITYYTFVLWNSRECQAPELTSITISTC